LRLSQGFLDVIFDEDDPLADPLQSGLFLHLLEATAAGGRG
jgi:hypothetical protein